MLCSMAALKVTVMGPKGPRVARYRIEVTPVIKKLAATPPKDEPRPRRKPSSAPPRSRSAPRTAAKVRR